MHVCAERNFVQRKRIAGTNVRAGATDNCITYGESPGMQYVTTFAIGVFDESNSRRTIGIVFDLLHHSRQTKTVALEIDNAIHALVTAATTAHGNMAMVVASATLLEWLNQRLLRS